MSELVHGLIAVLAVLFTEEAALAFGIAIILCSVLLCLLANARIKPTLMVFNEANKALEPVRFAQDDEAKAALRTQYQELARIAHQTENSGFQRAWVEFEECIVDPQADRLRNTVRPDEFFAPLTDQSRGLLLWANLAVALGLVLTFLGIIAALGSTAEALQSANGTASAAAGTAGSMQDALQKLLSVTAAKFLTSAAGVIASIILRYWDNRIQRRISSAVNAFTGALEKGLVYLPAQTVAVAQERHLEQLATAQSKLANELATAIAEKLSENFQPMVTVLGDIKGSIEGLSSDLTNGVTKSLNDSLSQTAGKEMQALAAALGAMGQQLGSIPQQLSSSAEDANRRIVEAAQLFKDASESMASSFGALQARIAQMGDAYVDQQNQTRDQLKRDIEGAAGVLGDGARQNGELVRAAGEEMKTLIGSLGATLGALQRQVADQATRNAKESEDATGRSRQALEEASKAAADALSTAASRLADDIRNAASILNTGAEQNTTAMKQAGADMQGLMAEVGSTLAAIQRQMAEQTDQNSKANRDSADRTRKDLEDIMGKAGKDMADAAAKGAQAAAQASAQVIEALFAEFAKRFDESARKLTAGISDSSEKLAGFGGNIERATLSAARQAETMAATASATERLGGQITVAANDATVRFDKAAASLAEAANPVREASEAIADGVEEVLEAIKGQQTANQQQVELMRKMAADLEAVVNAAKTTFADYEERFSDVDESLAGAVTALAEAATSVSEKLSGYSSSVDANLGNAVNALTGVIERLADLADPLEKAAAAARAA